MAKYKIIPSSRTIVQSPISIGHKAEKGVEAIEFDLTAWVETYGSGTLTVIMRRWGDAIPYPIALEIDENNKATWTLSDTDTAKAGMAYAQLSYIVGDEVVKKSDIYTFRVMDSLTGEGDPPEAYESWLEHLTHFAAEAMAEVLDIEGVTTDKTLTVDGGIADGKATGDALALKADKSTTYTKTEVDQMIEDVEVETDTTLEIAGAPADAAETGRQIGLLKADLGAVSLYNGTYPLELENGAINFAVEPWGYIAQDNRVRTKQGTKIHLKQGDIITFRYNRLFTLYVGWIDMSGVSHHSTDWEGFTFVAPEEGDYAFIIRPTTGTISLAEAQDSIYIKSAFDSQNNKLNNFVLLKPILYSVHSGYISSTGEITLPTSPKNEKYTDLIPVKNGYTIYTHLVYTDASISPSMWLVYCLYDKYKQFISRINIRPNNNGVVDDISKVIVNNADASYIQFSFGTWGDANYSFDIRSPYAIDIDLLRKANKIDLYSAKTTYNVRSILHRGYYGYPENTLIGYKEGKRQGFDIVECDVRFTSDHVAVLLHDTSINRTARNADGTELSSTVNIANITYDEAKTYDFGMYQGFPAGVTIPTFEEFLLLCKRLSLRPYVEVKTGTDEEITSLAVSAFEYGMLDKITWIADNYERLLPILAYDDTARVGYVTGKIEDWLVNAIQTYLQTGKNYAFAFTSDYGGSFDYHISKCKTAKIPVEIWIADDASTIFGLDPYITGIESNKLIAQEVLYKYALT